MRIQRTLQLAAAVSIVSVALLAATIVSLQIVDSHAAAASVHMSAAGRVLALMRSLPLELSGPAHQRAARQWQVQFAELTPILTTSHAR